MIATINKPELPKLFPRPEDFAIFATDLKALNKASQDATNELDGLLYQFVAPHVCKPEYKDRYGMIYFSIEDNGVYIYFHEDSVWNDAKVKYESILLDTVFCSWDIVSAIYNQKFSNPITIMKLEGS